MGSRVCEQIATEMRSLRRAALSVALAGGALLLLAVPRRRGGRRMATVAPMGISSSRAMGAGVADGLWHAAVNGSGSANWRDEPEWVCGSCVLDPLVYPLVYPDTYCAPAPTQRFNGSWIAPDYEQLAALEPYEPSMQSSILDVLAAMPNASPTIGVLGDSFTQQALDAMACELRRLGSPEYAGFMRWDAVHAAAGRFDEAARPMRYNWGGPHGTHGPRWFVLSQMYYNTAEVAKLLAVADVAIINYGLHYCQPARPGADASCVTKYRRYEHEMHRLFQSLQDHATGGAAVEGDAAGTRQGTRRRISIFQETSAQHFSPLAGLREHEATGDWELRDFFPGIGPRPPARCTCTPTSPDAIPLRTQLLRNLSKRYPDVRVLRLHDLLQPRYGWHQQDCKGRAKVRAAARRAGQRTDGVESFHGCDCTHYCHSPTFWRRYWFELKQLLV